MRKQNFKQGFKDLQALVLGLSSRADLSLAEKFSSIIQSINEFFEELRKRLVIEPFDSELEEIYFFKFEKPEFSALKIYYACLFNLLNRRPRGHRKSVRAFLLSELDYITAYFSRYRFYYEYYRSGATDLDEALFLRGTVLSSPVLLEIPELDPDVSTAGEFLFAKFQAYEKLQEYILSELGKLERTPAVVPVPSAPVKQYFEFTGELINMVELAYGLWLTGQLNGGKASLVEIFRWLEESMGIELGVPSNRFREIKRRKRLSRTHFMDQCRTELLKYMDQENALES